MRRIDLIVYHCSATEEGMDYTVEEITKWHKARGFRTIGYHFLIHLDGKIDGAKEGCRPITQIGAHAKGKNLHSIGVCYIGGVKDRKPYDTRTAEQIDSIRAMDAVLKSMFSDAESVGHRDLSVDLNGDGIIQPQEWMKACPSFSVKDKF
jgi:hypothetical protein